MMVGPANATKDRHPRERNEGSTSPRTRGPRVVRRKTSGSRVRGNDEIYISLALEHGREESVATMVMRKQPQVRSGVDCDAGAREFSGGVARREFRMRGEE
jgi:hypothetical protein